MPPSESGRPSPIDFDPAGGLPRTERAIGCAVCSRPDCTDPSHRQKTSEGVTSSTRFGAWNNSGIHRTQEALDPNVKWEQKSFEPIYNRYGPPDVLQTPVSLGTLNVIEGGEDVLLVERLEGDFARISLTEGMLERFGPGAKEMGDDTVRTITRVF